MGRVLITGATGFVGVNLALRFAQSGTDVIGVDLTPPDSIIQVFLGSLAGRVTFLQADVSKCDWCQLVRNEGIDLVVHTAAVTNLGQDEALRASDAVSVNVGGTATLLQWAQEAKPFRVIHASSGAIYGRLGRESARLDETATVDPESIYAVTKFASERVALRLAALAHLDLISVRLPPQFGPMERATRGRGRLSPVHSWCSAALRGKELLVNRMQPSRDYTYVADVAETIYRLSVAPKLNYRIYNISTGVPIGHIEIIAALHALVPGLCVRYVDDVGEDLTDRSPYDIGRLSSELGWWPQCDLPGSLSEYLTWLRSNLGGAELE